MNLIFSYEVSDSRIRHHNLEAQYTSGSALLRQKLLRYYAFKDKRELCPYLRLLMGSKYINYPVHCLGTRIGVKGGKGQVSGLCYCQRCFNSLEISHLAYEHHVRVLPQYIFQCILKCFSVRMDFSLIYDAFLVRMNKLNRVFYSNYMLLPLAVNHIYHGSKGGGFSTAGRTCNKYETTRFFYKLFNNGWKTELLK